MRDYTSQDSLEMLMRYATEQWMHDEQEYNDFRLKLTCADESAQPVVKTIECGMAVIAIETERYDLLDPYWLFEYKERLTRLFTRNQLLHAMQQSVHLNNLKGYQYIEEVDILQAVWNSFKNNE